MNSLLRVKSTCTLCHTPQPPLVPFHPPSLTPPHPASSFHSSFSFYLLVRVFQDKSPILHDLFFRDWMPGRELDVFVAKVMTTAIWGGEHRVGAHKHTQACTRAHTHTYTNISTFTCVCGTSCVWVTSCLQLQWKRRGLHTRDRGPLQMKFQPTEHARGILKPPPH